MQRRTLWSIVLILCSFSVLADIKVSIGNITGEPPLFLVTTKSNHEYIHSGHINMIDERFMRSGETVKIPVKVINPISFSYIYTTIYDPAYISETR